MADEKTTEVAVRDAESSAVPAFLKDKERTDRNNLDATDLTIPRIKLAQDSNAEVKEGDVTRGVLFLNTTLEELSTYDKKSGKGEPMRFIPILQSKEYILWRDQNDQGGGMFARARPVLEDGKVRYKWDKPNTEFSTKIKGVVPVTWKTGEYVDEDGLAEWGSSIDGDPDSKPAASVHYNYLVALPDHGNMIAAFSLAKSQVKRARDLNSMLAQGKLDCFARYIKVTVDSEHNDDNQEFFNLRFRPAGVIQDEALYNQMKDLHEQFVDSGFIVDQGNPDGDEGGETKGGAKKRF